MNEIILGLAISVIIIGFLILVGVALWLAAERRRNQSVAPRQLQRQIGSQPAAQQQPLAPQGQPPAYQPAAPPASATTPAETEGKASSAHPAGHPHKDVNSSGEYPSAALYDQTILPEPPKRRTHPPS